MGPSRRIGQGGDRTLDVPFRLFIESVQDYAIFMLDPDGYIVTWNTGAQRMKGYTEAEIVGRHFSTFYTQSDRDRKHPQYELEVATKVGRYEEEGWRVRKDGTMIYANVVITAIRDETGELIGFGKVTRDLTERRRQEEQERELAEEQGRRAQAEAANAAKSLFLTTMSHELRTPLNAIIGYVDLLELGVHGPLTEEQRVSLQRVRRSSKHLLSLINDVLNVARVEQGQVEYVIQRIPAATLLADVEPLVLPQFVSHGIRFTMHPCVGEVVALCDPDKTQQILLNLLSNAYKFTESGGTVRLECATDEDHVYFHVMDSGRGIDPDKLSVIFEPFVQIDRHLNQSSQQGVGLGLAISQDLAQGMGGDLTATSELNVGSRFTLTLPRDKEPLTI